MDRRALCNPDDRLAAMERAWVAGDRDPQLVGALQAAWRRAGDRCVACGATEPVPDNRGLVSWAYRGPEDAMERLCHPCAVVAELEDMENAGAPAAPLFESTPTSSQLRRLARDASSWFGYADAMTHPAPGDVQDGPIYMGPRGGAGRPPYWHGSGSPGGMEARGQVPPPFHGRRFITNFVGFPLVFGGSWETNQNFGRRTLNWEAVDRWGREWYGRGPGPGLFTRMHLRRPHRQAGRVYASSAESPGVMIRDRVRLLRDYQDAWLQQRGARPLPPAFNPGDEDRRGRARRGAAAGGVEEEARVLVDLLRSGKIRREHVQLLACLRDEAAMLVHGPCDLPHNYTSMVTANEHFSRRLGRTYQVLMALAIVEPLQIMADPRPWDQAVHSQSGALGTVCTTLRRWLLNPDYREEATRFAPELSIMVTEAFEGAVNRFDQPAQASALAAEYAVEVLRPNMNPAEMLWFVQSYASNAWSLAALNKVPRYALSYHHPEGPKPPDASYPGGQRDSVSLSPFGVNYSNPVRLMTLAKIKPWVLAGAPNAWDPGPAPADAGRWDYPMPNPGPDDRLRDLERRAAEANDPLLLYREWIRQGKHPVHFPMALPPLLYCDANPAGVQRLRGPRRVYEGTVAYSARHFSAMSGEWTVLIQVGSDPTRRGQVEAALAISDPQARTVTCYARIDSRRGYSDLPYAASRLVTGVSASQDDWEPLPRDAGRGPTWGVYRLVVPLGEDVKIAHRNRIRDNAAAAQLNCFWSGDPWQHGA